MCRAVGCFKARRRPESLMCMRHWRMVPPAIQQRLGSEYRAGQWNEGEASRGWVAAAHEAICAVMEKENLGLRRASERERRKRR